MPTVSQTQGPIPKSWDEFEDIVWELYTRIWQDPNTQRYGRTGQAQQGVDIYGRPPALGGGYAGIQCKRYEQGRLTTHIIEAEIAKAQSFDPPLTEYLIATTELRSAKLQEFARKLNGQREPLGRFRVSLVFWEDIWSHLSHPDNRDLLRKHYGDWLTQGFGLRFGAPFQAPPLPAHFVSRPEVSDALKERLLAEEETAPGVLVLSAIHGLGGIGKSVLAAVLAHDPEIQARFPDGVLWVTLGQRPELHSLLSGWIINGLRDYMYRPTTVGAASAHLRTLLLDKAALLVVDDVWVSEHARPFLVGSPRCHVLITTRRADVADEIGADLHQMAVMTSTQSVELLAARLGRPLKKGERQDAQCLARLVGYLPLALELAATRVARDTTWTELRAALEEEVARLETLDSARRRRKRATRLEASFNLSLDALRTDDEEAWQAFAWLGVLPEHVTISAPMAATLWNMKEADAADLLELLRNDALLLPGSPMQIGEGEWPGCRIHDLLHDIARALLTGDPPYGLGRSLQDAHAVLLERYKAWTQDGLWHTLPDDGYIHGHLTWHLEQAEQEEKLHALLREETAEGRNGWYEARERLRQTAGYLADVTRAWRLAEASSDTGLECRYALITASLNSLASNLPPTLPSLLVECGRWTPAQGLAYARSTPKSHYRVDALVELTPHLPAAWKDEALKEALAAARGMQRQRDRVQALAAVARHLPAEQKTHVLEEALATIREIGEARTWVLVFGQLAAHLPKVLKDCALEEALAVIRTVRSDWTRADALVELAPHLPKNLLEKALVDARAIGSDGARALALAGLLPRLSVRWKDKALKDIVAAAWRIELDWARVAALTELVPYLPQDQRARALEEALVGVRGMRQDWSRADALQRFAHQLEGKLLREALDDVVGMKGGAQAQGLAALAPHLSKDLLSTALQLVSRIENSWERSRALTALAPHLSEGSKQEVLEEALETAQGIGDIGARIWALLELYSYLPDEQKTKVLDDTFEALVREEYGVWRHRVLARLISIMPDEWMADRLDEVLSAISESRTGLSAPSVLAALVWRMPNRLLGDALTVARGIEKDIVRARALAAIAPRLPQMLLQEALSAALELQEDAARAQALAGIACHLKGETRAKVLGEVQCLVRSIGDNTARVQILVELIPRLPQECTSEVVQEALVAARALGDDWERVVALAKLAPYLPEGWKVEVLSEALTTALCTGEDWALSQARDPIDDLDWAETLTGLAPLLPEQLLEPTLALALRIGDEHSRSMALGGLAPYLPQQLLEKALAEARRLGDSGARALAMAGLAPHFPTKPSAEVLQEALEAAGEPGPDWARAEALQELACHLSEEQLDEALSAALAIELEWLRSKAVGGLVPHIAALPPADLRGLWRNTLRVLSRRTRLDLLCDFCTLEPVIITLDGGQTITEITEAIQDVGGWWP